MMEIFLLYLFTRIPFVSGAFIVAAIIVFAIGMGKCMYADTQYYMSDERKAPLFKSGRRWMLWSILPAFLFGLIPSQKDLGLILAGSAVIEVARSETAGRLASKSVQLIEQTLDGFIKKKE